MGQAALKCRRAMVRPPAPMRARVQSLARPHAAPSPCESSRLLPHHSNCSNCKLPGPGGIVTWTVAVGSPLGVPEEFPAQRSRVPGSSLAHGSQYVAAGASCAETVFRTDAPSPGRAAEPAVAPSGPGQPGRSSPVGRHPRLVRFGRFAVGRPVNGSPPRPCVRVYYVESCPECATCHWRSKQNAWTAPVGAFESGYLHMCGLGAHPLGCR